MDATAVIIALAVLLLLLVGLAVASGSASRVPRSISGVAEREAAMAAQADVEEHDIDEMIEARNALRARIGRPPLGEELSDEALRHERDAD
jgi:hypothetical protein